MHSHMTLPMTLTCGMRRTHDLMSWAVTEPLLDPRRRTAPAMHAFFVGIHRDMTGPSTTVPLDDAITVLAALLHAARPLTTSELAAALGWPKARAATAVQAAEHQPEVCGPLALQRTPSGAHLVTAQHGRLTPAQRAALAQRPGHCPSGSPNDRP
ncbi:helix-turn-helix domain-containing protein [Streptomyces decoyicus]